MKLILLSFFFFFGWNVHSQRVMQLDGEAQGTTYHILYCDSLDRDFYSDVEILLDEFDQSVSTYLPTSLISLININLADITVDDNFRACFLKAKEIWLDTDGAFDPTVYPLVNAWGFGPGKKSHPDSTEIDSILNFVGFDLIELQENHVVKSDPRVQLDFNAFAQGYSVDVVANFLESKGVNAYLVEIGGEVYGKGLAFNGDSWLVGIEKPIENSTSENPLHVAVALNNLAVATSGNYRKFIVEDGVKYGHQIDPKSGYPVKTDVLSVSVFAKDCLTADAYATGLSVMGLEKAKAFLATHPELQALLIYADEDGNFQIYETPKVQDILVELD